MKNNPHVNGESARQRTSMNLNSELCHDENGFQGFAERVPRHDFVSNAEICRNSRPGTVSQRRTQSIPALSDFSPLFSIVELFKCFSTSSFRVPCSNVLPSRVKMKIFTLIELLIVVAIIAILAGMLLPALNAARDKAKAIQCSGNFSSIGKAAMMYAADWHDYLPPGSNGDNSSDPNRKRLWGTGNTGAIAEYLNCVNDPILIGYVDWPLRSKLACPADSKQTDHYTLGYNMQLNNQVYRKEHGIHKLGRWKQPTRTMLALDAETSEVQYNQTLIYRHNTRTNVLFGDAHVITLRNGQIPHNKSGEPGYRADGWRSYFWWPFQIGDTALVQHDSY